MTTLSKIGDWPGIRQALDFLHWWADEILELCPNTIRQRIIRRFHPLTLRLDGVDSWVVEADGTEAPLAEALDSLRSRQNAPYSAQILLSLDALLRQEISLPKAARGKLQAAINLRLDSYSPWPLDRIRVAQPTLSVEPGSDDLRIALAIMPPEWVKRVKACMAQLDLGRARICSRDQDRGISYDFAMTGETGPARRSFRMSVHMAVSLVLIGSFGFLLWAAHQWADRRHASDLDELHLLRPRLLNAKTVWAEHQAITDLAAFHGQARSHPPMTVFLEDLSRSLPDTVWLTRVTIDAGTLEIEGEAQNVDRVTVQLGQIDGLQDVAVRGTEEPPTRADMRRFIASAQRTGGER